MKNTNLFNFQNGMSYALATLCFDNAIPYEPINYTSNYFEIDEYGFIKPINADLWIDPTKRTNNLTFDPRTYPSDSELTGLRKTYPELIDYSRNNDTYKDVIIHVNENKRMYILNKGWVENRAIIPLFLNNSLREYSKITVKYIVNELQPWNADYGYGRNLYLGVCNINKETGIFTYLKANGLNWQVVNAIGDYEISFDISQLDDVDYIVLYIGTAIWEITEMRLV